jgi:hypothetical protein
VRQDDGDPVQALELLGPLGAAHRLVRPDAGTFLAHQHGDDLELGAHGRQHATALGSRLDLAHGAGEHRDDADVVAIADASLAPRRGTASARLALATWGHRLLLRVPDGLTAAA